ncbi:TolC family outer membrane protein [Methylotuvimicrobium buryatense]|uniref:Channel protein TolC n=1 Tax=Methylotuvimicrobium buryatense TaxID=95641 RepID=A0A4P9UMQ4_METBY|nr:TolC family outer membrane protein [Methylotuvimicrobium buryatense]QCW81820.1 channel protein TolC [Methylotuvimicrobium buryatense]
MNSSKLYFFKSAVVGLFALLIQSQSFAQDLVEVYTQALENDPILKQALARQYANAESKDQGIARLLPSLSATGASSREWLHNKKAGAGFDFRGPQTNQEFWNNTFSLNFVQPVFHWDHWIQLSQSDNQIAQTEAEYLAELQNLMVKITEAYFNVLSAQDGLDFAVAEKNAIARQLEQAQQRFEVGLIAITDVYEAKAAHDLALANEIEADNNLDNQKEALREIIGEFDEELSPIGKELPLIVPEPNEMKAWSDAALNGNFSIISAFNQAEFARKAVDLQNSGHLPQLDIVGSYGVSDNTSTFGFRGDTQSIGLQLNVPLFEGGAVNSRTRQARQEFEAAKQNLIAAKRAVIRQVNNAYRGVNASISRVGALQSAVKSAESALEATEAGLDVGTRTMVEILAEQRNLYRAKRDHARSRYDYLINSIRLKQAASSLSENDLEYINSLLSH